MDDNKTLGEARRYVRMNRGKGVKCPCCEQFVKIYRRTINKAMVMALANLSAKEPGKYTHLPDFDPSKGDAAKLVHWGLIVEELANRPDGGRSGWWRITPKGRIFLQGHIRVPKYIYIFDSQFLGYDDEEQITVHDAWKTPFDLQALMGGR